jgi:hypothetical protein
VLDLDAIIAARTAGWENPVAAGLSSLVEELRVLGNPAPAVLAEDVARALIPDHMWKEGASFHRRFWEWLDSVGDGPVPPYVAIWFRGSGKSTQAEMGVVTMGANQKRGYCLYLCRNQDRADDHVMNIGSMLESQAVQERWPQLATRAIGKYGSPKGWRRSRLITAGGLIVDALGLDTAVRGVKIEFRRPDMAVLDDIDDHRDTLNDIEKRLETLSRGLLPALTPNAVIIVAQNLVHPDGVVARVLDKRSDILSTGILDGPIPAVEGLLESDRELPADGDGGRVRAVWPEGFPLEACAEEISRIGMTAFRREMQHEVHSRENALFYNVKWIRQTVDEIPELTGREMWIDPAVGADPLKGSLCGFLAGGRGVGPDGKMRFYIEWAHEERMTPEVALKFARDQARKMGIQRIGVETDQGGETWRPLARSIFGEGGLSTTTAEQKATPAEKRSLWGGDLIARAAGLAPKQGQADASGFMAAKAGSTGQSKYERWLRLLAGYERGEVIHVVNNYWNTGVLETALLRLPDREPFDLPDAAFWCWWSVLDKRRGGWRAL